MAHPLLRPWLTLAPLALAGPAAAAAVEEPRWVEYAQVTIRQRVIIRVPRVGPAPRPVGRTPMPAPIVYAEKKGPKCIAAASMAGAAVGNVDVVDLVLAGGSRVRAELDGDCAPLDFYSGFYLKPSADGMVCAGRDAIRVRTGARCEIKRFRSLVPKRKD
jgi:hypothetical protein